MRHHLVAALFVVACLACRPDTTTGRTRPGGNSAEDGTLVRRLETNLLTLNPVCASGFDRYVTHYLYTPLVYLDQYLHPIPGLAKAWTVSEDGRTYHFVLNEQATFADKTPVRASDVVFTLKNIVEPSSASPYADSFEYLDLTRTRAIGDHTVEIVFHRPLVTQLARFADVYVVPEHVYGRGHFRNDHNVIAVGSGPYRLREYVSNTRVVLERRTDYWADMPQIRTIVFKVIDAEETAWDALKTGELDEMYVSSDRWQIYAENPTLAETIRFRRFYTLKHNYVAWNARRPLFADPRVRRALAMCIPVEEIIQRLYHGMGRRMTGPFVEGEDARNPAVAPIGYDPAAAARLLASAGWVDRDDDGILKNGANRFTFEFLIFSGNRVTEKFAQIVEQRLKPLGIGVTIARLDPATGIERIREGKYDAAYLSVDADADPDLYGTFHSSAPPGGNIASYANPVADALMERARTEFDTSARQQLHWQLHKVLAEDQPYTWTLQVPDKWAISTRVRDVAISRRGLFLWYPGEFAWSLAPSAAKHGSSPSELRQ